jgi:hypothetical protein
MKKKRCRSDGDQEKENEPKTGCIKKPYKGKSYRPAEEVHAKAMKVY